MKKFFLALMTAVCTLGTTAAPAAQAADFSQLNETKVQLEDTLDASTFQTAFNKNCAYPIAGNLQEQTHGNYLSYLGNIDNSNAMIINANQAGKLSNIVLMHRGALDEQETQKLRTIFDSTLKTIGMPADTNGLFFANQAFDQLAVTDKEVSAARLSFQVNDRTLTFLKSVNPDKQLTAIVIQAVVANQ